MEIIHIPIERVAVLIGKNGVVKKAIEKECDVELKIAKDGEVEIIGDSIKSFFAKDVVKAIGRGFLPEEALKLLKENYQFYLIDLGDHVNKKGIIRIKGRVIGKEGKMKKEIETATESYVSVYGDTVGIISNIDTIEQAKEAVFMIINGAQHYSVYNYLAKAKREIMAERLR